MSTPVGASELGPSEHLTWRELACVDGTQYPIEWRTTRAQDLAVMFEVYRTWLGGGPLKVLSAYRTPRHNAQVGGAAESQHPEGRALDIERPSGITYAVFIAAAFRLAERGLVTGIGIYTHMSSVHLDRRPGKLTVWVK
jgi:uncharacterized protein YcbK (DUF882 family)